MDIGKFRELLKRERIEKVRPYQSTHEEMGYDENYDSGENFVRDRIVFYLTEKGFEVDSVSDKSEKGPDIILMTSPKRVIEVKGFPSRIVSRGKTKGKVKKESQRKLQAHGWIWEGIAQLIEHKCSNLDQEIALGLPDKEYYRGYLNQIRWFREKLSLYVYLVNKNRVRLYNPSESIA